MEEQAMALILPCGDHVPQVAPDAYLAPTATLIGNVTIGPEASVWFGAVLRGDDDAIVIEDVTIGHSAIVHGARVGACTLIGMGATVLNGAKIGPESIVGANALVSEGKEFPARSMILGVPGKLVRELDETAAAHGRTGAANYVARGKRYAAEAKKLEQRS
jgi:carbonic anhydrase/acetyltransferase-like protein (isoleucine patch superfamily)